MYDKEKYKKAAKSIFDLLTEDLSLSFFAKGKIRVESQPASRELVYSSSISTLAVVDKARTSLKPRDLKKELLAVVKAAKKLKFGLNADFGLKYKILPSKVFESQSSRLAWVTLYSQSVESPNLQLELVATKYADNLSKEHLKLSVSVWDISVWDNALNKPESKAPAQKIKTIKEFVLRVKGLKDISDAYDLIEDESSLKVQRELEKLGEGSNEPYRSAMHKLGFTDF